MLSGYCQMFVVLLFIITFLGAELSDSIGVDGEDAAGGRPPVGGPDYAGPAREWMPLIHYTRAERGDVVVFIKPVTDPDPVTGAPDLLDSGEAADRRSGRPHPSAQWGCVCEWRGAERALCAANDGRQSLGVLGRISIGRTRSRAWQFYSRGVGGGFSESRCEWRVGGAGGQVLHDGGQPAQQRRLAILGVCSQGKYYRSAAVQLLVVRSTEDELEQTGAGKSISWVGHVALHFFSDTRWKRTLKVIR